MAPEELRSSLRQQPFEPFRIVLTDGSGYDIRHPDLLLVGLRTAVVGLISTPEQLFFEQTVKVDLPHVMRVEPLVVSKGPPANGAA